MTKCDCGHSFEDHKHETGLQSCKNCDCVSCGITEVVDRDLYFFCKNCLKNQGNWKKFHYCHVPECNCCHAGLMKLV